MDIPELRGRTSMTVDEAAWWLETSRRTAYRMVEAGLIPSYRRGVKILRVPIRQLFEMYPDALDRRKENQIHQAS